MDLFQIPLRMELWARNRLICKSWKVPGPQYKRTSLETIFKDSFMAVWRFFFPSRLRRSSSVLRIRNCGISNKISVLKHEQICNVIFSYQRSLRSSCTKKLFFDSLRTVFLHPSRLAFFFCVCLLCKNYSMMLNSFNNWAV